MGDNSQSEKPLSQKIMTTSSYERIDYDVQEKSKTSKY
jgi:hypothetical protein